MIPNHSPRHAKAKLTCRRCACVPHRSPFSSCSSLQRGQCTRSCRPRASFFLPLEVNGRIDPIRYDGEAGYNCGNHAVPQSWSRGLIVGHEFSDRTEVYVELYDQQDANRIRAGQSVGNFATGFAKQRETTLGLGGRQALHQAKTLNLLLMGGRSLQTLSVNNSQPSWIAYVGLQILLGPKESETPQVEQKLPNESRP